ncbi:hypothetical protein D3C80_1228000 [compost metagenome]
MGIEARFGAGLHLHGFPDAAGHPPADQLVAMAHAARLRITVLPAKTFGTLPVARQQFLAGVGLALVGIAGGEIAPAQVKRVNLRCTGKLIHGAFQGNHPRRGARRTHVQRGVHIERGQAIAEGNVVALVEHATPFHHVLGEVLEAGGLAKRIVGDRQQLPVCVSTQAQALLGAGPVAKGEHLLASQRDAHRALQVQRRHHCQWQLVLRAQARAEGTADECRAHADVCLGQAKHLVQVVLAVLRALGLVVDFQRAVAFVEYG